MTETEMRSRSRRTFRSLLMILVLGAGPGAGIFLLGGAGPEIPRGAPPADVSEVRPNPGSSDGSAIHTLARLEPASGAVTVGARPGARIEAIQVKEGEEVKPGELLAILEGHEEALARLALAEAQKQNSDRIRSLQKDKLALERKQYDDLKEERLKAAKRVRELNAQKLQELKLVDSKLVQALGNDARAKLDVGQVIYQLEIASLKSNLDLKDLQADQELQKARRELEDKSLLASTPDDTVLARQIDLAKTGVSQTEVRAPASGRILELSAHAGEVSTGSLLVLGDVSSMVARAEVYQTDVAAISIGDLAEAQILGKSIRGRITRVGRIVGRNELRSVDPRALQDLRIVKVTVALDDSTVASNYVNMQVDVTIRTRQTASK